MRRVIAIAILLAASPLWAADRYWVGGAPEVKQVEHVDAANVEVGDKFKLTIGDHYVEYEAAATTEADVLTGLETLCEATTAPPEFGEVVWSQSGGHLVATASVAGVPFSLSASTTNVAMGMNTQTLVVTHVTDSAGPEHLDDPNNWDGGTLPDDATDDRLIFTRNSFGIRYGLAVFSGQVFDGLVIEQFTGVIGLPVVRPSFEYAEYRPRYLTGGFTTVTIGSPDASGLNSGMIRLNTESEPTTLRLFGSSSPAELHAMAVEWIGDDAANVIEVSRGTLGIARVAGETATLGTLRILSIDQQATDALVVCGEGATVTNIEQRAGVLGLRSNPTNTTLSGGVLYMLRGSTSLGTLKLEGGTIRGGND